MKNSIVKLQSYFKTSVTFFLLAIGVSSAWAKTVYFKNTGSWSAVKCHYWGGTSGTSWPGATMTRIGTTAYYKQDIGNNTMCIFHNNSGTQTADQTAQDGKICYFNNNSPYWNYGSITGLTIYFDIRNVTDWGTPYLRVGRSDHNSASSMSLVAGTKYLYSASSPGYDNYSAYTIANSQGWTNSHTIYQPSDEKPTGDYAITKLINYQNSNILENNVYFQATSIGSTSDGADYWNVTTQNSLPSYTVSYSKTGSGTLTVTQYNGSSYVSLSSTVKPTQIIKITATPSSGYGLSDLSISGATKIGDTDTYYVTANTTITATFEVTHDVTISYKCGTATIKTATTETAVGTSTPRSVSAPDIDGYTFSSWTKGSGITIKSGTTSTATISIISGASGNTLQANYTAKACKLYKFSAAKNGTSTDKGAMTFDESTKVYYIDITTDAKPFYFRFYYNSGTYYSTDWAAGGYTSGKTVAANGDKVDCDKDVTSWGDKPSIVFNGLNSSAIRIWFDYQNKKVWITETQYTVTINDGDHGTVSPNGSQSVGKNSGKSITATPSTGYNFTSWSKTGGAVLTSATTNPTTLTATATGTVTATYTAKTYSITLDREGASTGSTSVTMTYNSSSHTAITAPEKTGYTFGGWWSGDNGTGSMVMNTSGVLQAGVSGYTGAGGIWTKDATCTLYAKWTANNYTVTIDVDEPHKGSTGGATTSKSVTFNSAPSNITVPTAEDGYGLDGYYTDHDGEGVKVIDSLGVWKTNVAGYTDGSKRWVHDGDVTLYAYYKKATIEDITLSPNPVNPSTTVTATPVIKPTPRGTTKVCWRLLHSNGSPLDPQPTFSSAGGNAVTFSSPATGGTYKVEAVLRKGSVCGSGEVLDSVTSNLIVAASHIVTIKYMCGDEVIQAQTTVSADPINWTPVSAPTIFGYTFSTWVPGDGITLQSYATTNSNKVKASYDGVLTARYTKKKLILLDLSQTFSPYGKWDNPYVYFYKASYWDDTNGTGEAGEDCIWYGAMTKIAGTDIWYYDYSSVPATFNGTVSFTWGNHVGETHFGDVSGCDVIYRGDFSEGTPLFVPATDQSKEDKNSGQGHYYFKGYWTNYIGENTGYTLIIRENNAGAAEIKRQRFTSADKHMTMQATLPLDANTSYKMEILRDNGRYYKNAYFMKDSPTEKHTNWAFTEETTIGGITSTAAGNYVFTLSYSSGELRLSVEYPAKANDFQILYYDSSNKTHWSKTHSSGWRHPSRLITAKANAVDTVAFFVAKKGYSPTLYARKVNSINAESGQITWGSLNIAGAASKSLSVDSSYVYLFKVTQSSTAGTIASIENIGAYNGNYYIRCGALNSKWDNYAHDYDHRMTYTAYSESSENPGTKYSHYKAKWCPRGKRVNFCIANDYSACITDTLWQDDPNTYDNIYPENDGTRPGELKAESYDGEGHITSDVTTDKYSANIRFMWNRKTNKIGRAYVASATTAERQYLVLKGCNTILNGDGSDLGNPGEDQATNRAIFKDDQDFIYERIITIQPTTHAKVYACYTTTDLSKAQYFRGTYDGGACGSDANSIQIIGGSGSEFYKVRVIYDFKTNRLICAWMPNGTDVGVLDVQADVMVIRDHQQGAEAITFTTTPKGELSDVKYTYGVMRFNRWTLNNRARGKGGADDQDENHCKTPEAISEWHPVLPIEDQTSIYERALYFISFPFDVQLSEVFGLGTYGIHWVISEYNGLRRAQEGYFQDNCFNSDCTNWDYIWNPQGKVLKAYEGYLLSLEIDSMLYDNTRFWPNNISQKELYFPSAKTMGSITSTNITIDGLGEEYQCTKNYNIDGTSPIKDRRVYDSYWRCIGTPSYAPYGAAVKNESGSGSEITWKTNYTWKADFSEFPFLYAWNVDDNSLSAQSTSRFNFKPLHAYLIQNKNAMYWTAVSATPQSIVRRQRRAVDEDGDYYWRILLSREDKEDDQAYVRMSDNEQVTDTFDFGQDLSKEFNYGHSDIYTYIGQTRAAANSMPVNTETTTIIPLGLNIWASGQHTISMPDGGDGVGVELVDLYNGVRVNLSAGFVYNFEAEKGYIEDRFQLEISPVKGTHTGIENVNVESADESKARKVLIDGALYIVRDGKMYDARGARIK